MHTDLPTAKFANIHFVAPQLAFGGDLSPHDAELSGQQFAEIGKLGITHVVDVRIEWSDEQTFAEQAPHVRYLHHGMDDAGQSVPPEWFEEAVSWIEAAWAEDPDAVVLAHCHMGINRGPSLAFAVLLALGWEPVEAISALRSARQQANVWYAADALAWHHQRVGTDSRTAAEQHAALAAWREDNPLDVVRLIREVRDEEYPF
ncbi:MAG: dual specificity protein phosphatase family protein [Actinomycetota bacterium]|nr:dual specificity protein phosphatase family protein [Actinomycetota bacterium]